MIDQETPKYYNTRYQDWMTLSAVQYLKQLALDQTLVVRETPQSSVEKWQEFFQKVVSQ